MPAKKRSTKTKKATLGILAKTKRRKARTSKVSYTVIGYTKSGKPIKRRIKKYI